MVRAIVLMLDDFVRDQLIAHVESALAECHVDQATNDAFGRRGIAVKSAAADADCGLP